MREVSLSSAATRARVAITLNRDEGLRIVLRDCANVARLRVATSDGDALVDRSAAELDTRDVTVDAERADSSELREKSSDVVVELDASKLFRRAFAHDELVVSVARSAVEHPRSVAHDAKLEHVATIRLRRASLRAIELVALSTSVFAGVGFTALALDAAQASSLRRGADIATALLTLAPFAGWLGLGRARSPRATLAAAAVAMGAVVLSARASKLVVDVVDPSHRSMRYLPGEVASIDARSIRAGSRTLSLAPECFASEPTAVSKLDRLATAWRVADRARYRRFTAHALEPLGIIRGALCSGGECCVRIDPGRETSARIMQDPSRSAPESASRIAPVLRVGAGSDVEAAPELLADRPLRVELDRSVNVVSVDAPMGEALRLRWDPTAFASATAVGLDHARREAPFELQFRTAAEVTLTARCPAQATEVSSLMFSPPLVTAVTLSSETTTVERTTGVAMVCRRDALQGANWIFHATELDWRRDAGPSRWDRFTSTFPPEANAVQLEDRARGLLVGVLFAQTLTCEARVYAVRVAPELRELTELRLLTTMDRPLVWQAQTVGAPVALVAACREDAPRTGSFNTMLRDAHFAATLSDGLQHREVHAMIREDAQGRSLVASTEPPPVMQDCCRLVEGHLEPCARLEMMTRIPHERRRVSGVSAVGCRAVFDLVARPHMGLQ